MDLQQRACMLSGGEQQPSKRSQSPDLGVTAAAANSPILLGYSSEDPVNSQQHGTWEEQQHNIVVQDEAPADQQDVDMHSDGGVYEGMDALKVHVAYRGRRTCALWINVYEAVTGEEQNCYFVRTDLQHEPSEPHEAVTATGLVIVAGFSNKSVGSWRSHIKFSEAALGKEAGCPIGEVLPRPQEQADKHKGKRSRSTSRLGSVEPCAPATQLGPAGCSGNQGDGKDAARPDRPCPTQPDSSDTSSSSSSSDDDDSSSDSESQEEMECGGNQGDGSGGGERGHGSGGQRRKRGAQKRRATRKSGRRIVGEEGVLDRDYYGEPVHIYAQKEDGPKVRALWINHEEVICGEDFQAVFIRCKPGSWKRKEPAEVITGAAIEREAGLEKTKKWKQSCKLGENLMVGSTCLKKGTKLAKVLEIAEQMSDRSDSDEEADKQKSHSDAHASGGSGGDSSSSDDSRSSNSDNSDSNSSDSDSGTTSSSSGSENSSSSSSSSSSSDEEQQSGGGTR